MRFYQSTSISGLRSACALLVLFTQLLTGCDNPACVFGPAGCQGTDGGGGGGGGGAGGEAGLIANPPQDGERLTPSAPEVKGFFPGNGAHEETPIVLIFSESMDPAGIADAFELIQQSTDPNIPDLPGIPLPGVLVGEGRVPILTPIALIPSSSYQVGLREDASLTDRTGLLYDAGASGIVGNFSVSANPNPTPQLLTMWPQRGSVDQSTLPEIVAIFDRVMDEGSVTAGGAFSVAVNGAPPANNPSASVLTVTQYFGTVVTIPQVYTWRSFEPSGEPALLGLNAEVSLALSSTIKSEGDDLYAGSSESFTTALVNPPASVAITSIPTDAFGVNHVNGTTPLEVTVTLEGVAGSEDFLTLYAYGTSETAGSPSLLTREVSLTPGATTVTLGESELDLVDDSFEARFEDGDVYIAASVRRGNARSPVRLLDTDPLESGSQPAVLDTVPPVLVGLGTDGAQTTEYISTSSGLTVVGLAEEELAAVEVEVFVDGTLYTNGSLTPVIEANKEGAFIAKQLDLGIVDPALLPAALTVTIYDRAMNPAVPLDLSWRQVGASGPGAALPVGGDVSVRVFDSATNLPVSGALIFSHEVDVVETFLNGAVADADGMGLVPSAASGATVITVDAAGYDLFTFHGVPTTRLDVPLQLTGGSGRIIYSVFSDVSELADPSVQVRVADDRLLSGPTQAPVSCTDSPFGVLCGFPNADITAGRFGASTLLATVDQGIDFAAADFLKVADLEVLTGAVAPNAKLSYEYEITGLLSDIGVEIEERPLLAPASSLDLFSLVSFDSMNLAAGSPSVLIEGAVPSLGGVATVGAGVAEDFLGLGLFVVQGAYAGAADGVIDDAGDLEGRWVTEGLVEADLFFRVDLEDTSGNKTGRRLRFSEVEQVFTIAPPDVPVLVSPAFNTGGSSFQLEFMDTLDDTQDGLFRVHMTDDNGRSWDVWHLNEPGFGQSITANVPEIASLGGQPLVDGQLEVVVSLRGVPSGDFDAGSFLWRTILEQADSRADTAHITLQQ